MKCKHIVELYYRVVIDNNYTIEYILCDSWTLNIGFRIFVYAQVIDDYHFIDVSVPTD